MKPAPNALWAELRTVLNEHDPIHIHSPGVNDDEYDPEIPHILAALRASDGPESLAPKLQAIFERMFDEAMVRRIVARDQWHALADDVRDVARPYDF